jgi:hypothetical protein
MSQKIHRAPRRHQWLVIDKRTVEDVRLTWAARGLLAYLLSRPDDWEVLVKDLIKRGNLKRDGIYTLLRELRAVGYVRYDPTRDARGRLRGGTYVVSELPLPDSPDTDSPDTAAPDTAEPDALLTTELNLVNNNYKLLNTTYRASNETGARAALLPDWLDDKMRCEAHQLLAPLVPPDAQRVADEWIGAWQADRITRSPLGFLATLVKRCQDGTLEARYGGEVPQ